MPLLLRSGCLKIPAFIAKHGLQTPPFLKRNTASGRTKSPPAYLSLYAARFMGRVLASFKLLQGTSLTFIAILLRVIFFSSSLPLRPPSSLLFPASCSSREVRRCGCLSRPIRMTVAMELGWQVAELCTSTLSGKTSTTSKAQAWSEDPQKILSLMMGKPVDIATNSSSAPIRPFHSEGVQLDHEQDVPLPSGWEKRLDLKSGSISFVNCSTGLSTIDDPRVLQTGWLNRNSSLCLDLLQSKDAASHKSAPQANNSPTSTLEDGHLDLELNLGYKARNSGSAAASKMLLKEKSLDHPHHPKRPCSSEDFTSTGIIVTGCKSCLMYVMLSQTNPQCPRCGSYVVLDTPPSNPPLPKKFKP